MKEKSKNDDAGIVEIALTGDMTENEADWSEKILGVEPGGECVLYFDSRFGNTSGTEPMPNCFKTSENEAVLLQFLQVPDLVAPLMGNVAMSWLAPPHFVSKGQMIAASSPVRLNGIPY